MANILITQHIGGKGVHKLREAGHAVTYRDKTDAMSPDELQTAVRHCQGLICLLTDPVDTAVLNAAPNLKMVANVAVGYDNIDLAAATERGILVSNTPDVLTETTADHAFALLLGTSMSTISRPVPSLGSNHSEVPVLREPTTRLVQPQTCGAGPAPGRSRRPSTLPSITIIRTWTLLSEPA